MKPTWKEIAASPGYKSLKAAYIKDIQENQRSKKESYAKFNQVISWAKSLAARTDASIITILNTWEADRDYWWLNYYQSYQFQYYKHPKKWKYSNKNKVGRKDPTKKERWPYNVHRKHLVRQKAYQRKLVAQPKA